MAIGLFHYDTSTCTLEDTLTCILRNSGASAEENVNFADDEVLASFDEPENYLTATTF